VALYPATSESEKISFNQINKTTGQRIKYARVDAESGEEVANEDIVKGYKVDTDTYIEVTKDELENITAVIRETIRSMDMVAIGRVVLTNREHIALEPMDEGLIGMLLRYPYEVRSESEYFDEIQDVKVTKDILDLAKHIVEQKSAHFQPDNFEDHYEAALVDLINSKRAGKPTTPKERPRGENVVDLMEAFAEELAAQPNRRNRRSRAKSLARPQVVKERC
jgi:DNA end-binding protein Ku